MPGDASAAPAEAVRFLTAAGYEIRVGKAGRIYLQLPLFGSGSDAEAAVQTVLATVGSEVRRVLPKRPRARRLPKRRRS